MGWSEASSSQASPLWVASSLAMGPCRRCQFLLSPGGVVEQKLLRPFFNDCLDNDALVEPPLLDRRFTWTNRQRSPTLVKLYQLLVNDGWCTAFSDSSVTSVVSRVSYHIPIILTAAMAIPRSTIFCFSKH